MRLRQLLNTCEGLPFSFWQAVIREARALVVNGFVFDELEPSVVCQAVRAARDSGTAVFFDLGPRVRAVSIQPPRSSSVTARRVLCPHLLRLAIGTRRAGGWR